MNASSASSNADHPLPEAVLENLSWVQSLARNLASTAAAADDLAQETWRRAIENPPPSGLPLRPWLGGILRRTAHDQRRSEARRRSRERRAARPEAVPTDHELASRMEQSSELAQLVMQLKEPYRRTVLLRYFDGLGPQAIASQEDLPLATVRTRLRRALGTLRGRVDERQAGSSQAWLLLLAGQPAATTVLPLAPLALAMQSKFALALAIAAVLGGAFWWSRANAAAPQVLTAGIEASPAQGRPAPPAAPVPAPTAAPVDGGSAARTEGTSAPADTLTLRAVNAESGELLARAHFWILPAAELPKGRNAATDLEPLAVAHGKAWEAGESGSVRIPRPSYNQLLVARAGDRYGTTYLSGGSPAEVEVMCLLDRALLIQVVDGSNQPVAGVGVMLQESSADSRQALWEAVTEDPKGIARLAHLDRVVPAERRPGKSFSVTLGFPVQSRPQLAADLEGALDEPLVLELPPTGSMTVDLVGPGGKPHPIEGWVYVTSIEARPGGGTQRGERLTYYLRNQSRLSLPHVGLGMELLLSANPGGQLRPVERAVQGPTQAGESVAVELACEDRYPAFRGRIVGAGGSPMAALIHPRLSTQIVPLEGSSGPRDRFTYSFAYVEADGTFLLPVREEIPPQARYRVRILRGEDRANSEPLFAEFVSSMPSPGEVIEVGALELARMPLIASGVVRDSAGEPLEGADIQTGEKINVREDPDDFNWGFSGLDMAYTDGEGRFELRGFLPPGEYALWPRLRNYQNQGFVAFQHGDRSVELVLDAATSLSGKVLLPAELPFERLRVELRYHGVDPKSAFYHLTEASLRGDGAFVFADLPPGTLDLVVRSGRLSEPLYLASDLVLQPGAEARVVTIDLRSELRLIDVLALDAADEPLTRAYVTTGGRSVQLLEGRARIIARSGPTDLTVHAPGYLTSQVPASDGQTIVRLTRTIPVDLHLATTLPAAPAGTRVLVNLWPRSGLDNKLTVFDENYDSRTHGQHQLLSDFQRVDGMDGARLHVPALGSYELQWMIVHDSGPYRSGGSSWIQGFRQAIEVVAEGQRIDFDPDLAAYATALSEAK